MTTDSPAGNGPVDRNVGRREHDPNHPYVRKLSWVRARSAVF